MFKAIEQFDYVSVPADILNAGLSAYFFGRHGLMARQDITLKLARLNIDWKPGVINAVKVFPFEVAFKVEQTFKKTEVMVLNDRTSVSIPLNIPVK